MKKFCLVMGVLMITGMICPFPSSAQSPVSVTVTATAAPIFVKPDPTRTPLRLAEKGTNLNVLTSEGEWYLVEWDDSRWGRRVGYIEKRHVNALVAAPQQSVDSRVAESTPPAPRTLESAQPRSDQVAAPVVPAAAQSDRSGFTLMVDMGLGIQSDTALEESAVGLAGLNLGLGGWVTDKVAILGRF